jgi:hypothetical protein
MKKVWFLIFTLTSLFSFITVSAEERVDVNTASIEELIEIIHIGEARARELISLRPFYSLDDLERIKGISLARVKDIKNQGLAWVDPSLKPEVVIEEVHSQEIIEKEEPQEEVIGEESSSPKTDNSSPLLPVYLGAGFTSVFSGAIILLLKKNIKK